MVKVAKKYRAGPDAPNPSEAARMLMPIWYHCGAEDRPYGPNSKSGKCLRDKHGVRTVADCMRVAVRAAELDGRHRKSAECKCVPCTEDRIDRGCDNPARCATAAAKMLESIRPKWNPARKAVGDNLSVTRSGRERNRVALVDNERVVFNPSVSQDAPLAMVFRVFRRNTGQAKAAVRPPKPYQVEEEEIEVYNLYTDGSCTRNGKEDARAGSGMWIGANDPRNRAARVPHNNQTNQTGELYAVLLAHEAAPPFAPLHIVTD
ncbi:hypothetical protein C8Q70DRAFT_898377, partial [Cubamyces menziesii]